jgi:hypothetical protein
MLVYTYNPSYSQDGDWKDHGSKTARAKSQQDPILKKQGGYRKPS